MTEELKPCPFCGGGAKLKHGTPSTQIKGKRQAFVQCAICFCRTPTFIQYPFEAWQDVDTYAIQAWNRRID